MSDDPYLYPGTTVLRNKLGIRDADELDRAERQLVSDRISQGIPSGNLDLDHLCAIHRHLFQDVHDWAGQLREVGSDVLAKLELRPVFVTPRGWRSLR